MRHPRVVITSSCESKGPVSLRASGHLHARPHWTWDCCGCLSSSRHLYFRGSRDHRIRIWSDGCASHPSTRKNFRGPHQPSNNTRPHCRRKNESGNVCSVHFVSGSGRSAGGVHGETDLQPIWFPGGTWCYETGQRLEPSFWDGARNFRDLRAGNVRILRLITSSQEAGRSCAYRFDFVRHHPRAGSANERLAKSGSKSWSSAGVRIFYEPIRLLDRASRRGFNCRTRLQILRAAESW